MRKFVCGETVTVSGYYKAYDKNGNSHDSERTYLEEGSTFPPLQHEGGYWVRENH